MPIIRITCLKDKSSHEIRGNGIFEIKDTEKTPMAPTVSIEQISIVRPIKVRMLTCYKAVGRGY
jgi:preprotein translocase subunit SecB